MDASTGQRLDTAAPRGGASSASIIGALQVQDGGTFIINPDSGPADGGELRRPPVSAAGFNHMFSPLTIEQMFLHSPARETASNTGAAMSLAGMLWQNSGGGGGGDGSIGSAGDTLRQLLSNGSNPAENGSSHHQQDPRLPQQYHSQHMEPLSPTDNESQIAPYSPPDTIGSGASIADDALPRLAAAAAAATAAVNDAAALHAEMLRSPPQPPPRQQLSHRRSAQMEPRRLPLIQNQAHLRPSSQASMASLSVTSGDPHRGQGDAQDQHGDRAALTYATQSPHMFPAQPTMRAVPATANPLQRVVHRPAPMPTADQSDFYNQPLQVHSAIGSGSRQPADLSLRHEVLDKVARRSHPTTPHDAITPLPNGQRPTSMVQGPSSVPSYGYPCNELLNSDITMLPGDSRARAYMWDSSVRSEQQMGLRDLRQHRQQRGGTLQMDTNRTGSVSRVGSLRRIDYPGIGQVRKSSDSSAQLLTPKDFIGSLPDRIGDMVLNRELGEWVNINDYVRALRTGSPDARGAQVQPQEAPARVESRGPSSKRSSISIHSHMSAFPLPLPTNEKTSHGPYGIGLISPVENQRKQVHEMAERQPLRRGASMRERPIVDDALGSIVQRLMTPVASPEACTSLDLSGAGIRSLAGLSQITSRLEAISLAGNKLQSLAGLPMGLVSLRAPSNWIRFSPGDRERFIFARELPHLEEIDLSTNEISDIGIFSGLRHLRVLELSRNRIESLRELRGCRRLLHLRLRDNALTSFELDASEAPLLTTLDLCNNRLRIVPASIADFAQLTKINMVKNDLEKIELRGPAADAVRELRLSENPLIMRRNGGAIDADAWMAKFPNLRTLYLDVCNIRQLCRMGRVSDGDAGSPHSVSSAGEGVGWLSLFNLSLRGNALQPPLDIDFACLCNVKNLYSPDTRMALPRMLPQLTHLLQLVVCNTGLVHLPANMGAALPHLKLLDVSHNPELVDLAPILQLAPSLEILKCRAVGFGGLGNVIIGSPVAAGAEAAGGQLACDELALLALLSRLRQLRRLDLRFNRCTSDMYAPLPVSVAAGRAASVLDGALSPLAQGQSVMGEAGHAAAAAAAMAAVSGGMSRFDEEVWLRQDQAYVAGLKMSRQGALIRRRESYWIAAIQAFPWLEELDGIKAGPR
ncbi:Leucine-rich repeat protein [Coemansia biformis]|uniref:Leucine-rich repeat protein n=1 Tax=Coemansia biformis TaxID=1286918 RepID=A0A9W8CY76_9FUNG|nr:Leucine-rich repeat protein [Coemansia biformis]